MARLGYDDGFTEYNDDSFGASVIVLGIDDFELENNTGVILLEDNYSILLQES
jgi:hypothetical protein